MKEGMITDIRIQPIYRQVEIDITCNGEKTRYFAPYTAGITNIRKGMQCQFKSLGDKLTMLIVDGVNVLDARSGKKDRATANVGSKATASHSSKPRRIKQQGKPRIDQGRNETLGKAKAPYNFVSVNDIVVKAPVLADKVNKAESMGEKGKKMYYEIPSFDRYHEVLKTGYINLDIEALTPLYIRDSYDADEEIKADDAQKKNEKWENPDFFSPGGTPKIPGSSLRGMTRNLVEIVSYSRMEYVEDSTLYYRSLADKCGSIKNEYFRIMGQRGPNKNNPGYKFNAGYLQRDGHGFQILPATRQNGRQYQRIPKTNKPEFSWHWQNNGSCITVSGSAPNGKTKDWLINPVDKTANPIKISRADLNSYRDDTNRFKDKRNIPESEKQDGDLLRCLRVEESKKNSKNMVPCFYVTWTEQGGGQHVAFGHTAYFRLAYRSSIRQHLPVVHRNDESTLDLTSAIFGQVSNFAGRVFFEDALINSKDLTQVSEEEVYLKILSNPKPTTFQHYLEQRDKNKNNLAHWNNKEALLRGYKLYWHRKTPQKGVNGWEASLDDVKKSPSQYTAVKTIDKGTHFRGRIRFENLSDIELGALLFVLELPDCCAHKIGMGKPLGLGSVRIKPTLTLDKRTDKAEGRYGRLFNEREWHLAEEPGQTDELKACFAEYMLQETKHDKASSDPVKAYWDTERMQELRAMLDFDQNTRADGWLERTRYMEIERKVSKGRRGENEFKERPVLASPLETIKAAGIKYE